MKMKMKMKMNDRDHDCITSATKKKTEKKGGNFFSQAVCYMAMR
jgi:hypothetical protein